MVESHLILKPLFRPAMNLAVAIYLSGTIPFSYVCDVQKKRVISQEVSYLHRIHYGNILISHCGYIGEKLQCRVIPGVFLGGSWFVGCGIEGLG